MHHIQRKILQQLLYSPALPYAKLRPDGVESNHFAYHLDQLLREKLIIKGADGYTLSAAGLALADRASHSDMAPRLQPHIVTSLYITNDQGQLLLYQHRFQPYIGLFGPPQGRIHYAEHIADAAQRELSEKTGLQDVSLTHRGMVYIHTTKDDTDVSMLLAHVFSGNMSGAPDLADSADGMALWQDPSQLRKDQCMPGFVRVYELLQAAGSELFFAEIEAQLA